MPRSVRHSAASPHKMPQASSGTAGITVSSDPRFAINSFLITRLPQLASAEYKLGTLVCLQRGSRGLQLSAVPERAQRSRVRAAVRHGSGVPRGAAPLALAGGLRVPDLRRATP